MLTDLSGTTSNPTTELVLVVLDIRQELWLLGMVAGMDKLEIAGYCIRQYCGLCTFEFTGNDVVVASTPLPVINRLATF